MLSFTGFTFNTFYLSIWCNKQKSSAIKKVFTLDYSWTISLLLLPIFIASFLPYWSTGILGQARTMILAWLFFMLIWLVNLSIITHRFRSKFYSKTKWLIPIEKKFCCFFSSHFWQLRMGFICFLTYFKTST